MKLFRTTVLYIWHKVLDWIALALFATITLIGVMQVLEGPREVPSLRGSVE